MSKEHYYARWLRKYLPPDGETTSHNVLRPDGLFETGTMRADRSLYAQTIRKVCKRCNGGWMSRLQVKVKPILQPLVSGETNSVPSSTQADLARWLTMSFMVHEQSVPDLVTTPFDVRRHFSSNQDVPPHWRILLGRVISGSTNKGAMTSAARFVESEIGEPEVPNFLVGVVPLGGLAAVVLGAQRDSAWALDAIPLSPKLDQLWPPQGDLTLQRQPLSDDELVAQACVLRTL
ncbi:hypothetical protein [Sphingomonas sp. DC2300-3]|uniref:hypothetical protein n=1 Tax=unclassified Sphingomonas TaxID=196159 RepID=UPI003CEA41DE